MSDMKTNEPELDAGFAASRARLLLDPYSCGTIAREDALQMMNLAYREGKLDGRDELLSKIKSAREAKP